MRQARQNRWLGLLGMAALAVAVILLWPAPDPLAGAQTVAVRIGDSPPAAGRVDYLGELRMVLSGRDLKLVSDESSADRVLVLTEFRLDLGDIELVLSGGRLRGRAQAACIVTDLQTGETHVMDFVIRFLDGQVHAELIPRKFWQFWK
jgi:hypothetical protein